MVFLNSLKVRKVHFVVFVYIRRLNSVAVFNCCGGLINSDTFDVNKTSRLIIKDILCCVFIQLKCQLIIITKAPI